MAGGVLWRDPLPGGSGSRPASPWPRWGWGAEGLPLGRGGGRGARIPKPHSGAQLVRGAEGGGAGGQGAGSPANTPPGRPPRPSPTPPAPHALTVLLGQGQVRRGEGQERLVAHVPVQQARNLAMEAGPEVEVLEFQVHLQGEERSPGRGWESPGLKASHHFLTSTGSIWLVGARSGVESPQFDAFNRLWPPPGTPATSLLNPLRFHLGAWGPWGSRREGSQALLPLCICTKLFLCLVSFSTT